MIFHFIGEKTGLSAGHFLLKGYRNASKFQSWDLNPGLIIPKAHALFLMNGTGILKIEILTDSQVRVCLCMAGYEVRTRIGIIKVLGPISLLPTHKGHS